VKKEKLLEALQCTSAWLIAQTDWRGGHDFVRRPDDVPADVLFCVFCGKHSVEIEDPTEACPAISRIRDL